MKTRQPTCGPSFPTSSMEERAPARPRSGRSPTLQRGKSASWTARLGLPVASVVLLASAFAAQPDNLTPTEADGYRGIWYMNQPVPTAHRYKYSGGFATYPQQHVPIAIYA